MRASYVDRKRPRFEWLAITLILLLAALLRFHNLGDVPKGLEHDEVATWHMVSTVLDGHADKNHPYPLYFEEGYGHEPLYNYLTTIPMSLFGHNWLGERFWAPWFGLFAVAATYALMRRMFNTLVGLSAAGFQATVLWAFFFNRLGLRLNLLPFLLCATVYYFWRGAEISSGQSQIANSQLQNAGNRSPPASGASSPTRYDLRSVIRYFSIAGILMGLCFYTYMSSIVVLPMFGAFFLYRVGQDAWKNKPGWHVLLKRWWPMVACFVIALLVMMPLVLYRLNRPENAATPQREGQVDMPLRELLQGNLNPILQNAWALIKMWNIKGELYWQLNVADRPVFIEPISGALFWIGMLVVLWRWQDPRMALLLLWIGFGMLPSLITSEAPSWPRTMLASPAALALPGIAVAHVREWSNGQIAARTRPLSLISLFLTPLLLVSLLLTAALTYRDFLVLWPRHPRVRYAFQSSMTEAMRYLDAQADKTPVVMAGLSPHDMDPWTEQCTLQRRDLNVRWIDTRTALVLPQEDGARLVTLDITPVDPALADWIALDTATILAQGKPAPRSGRENEPDAPVYVDPAFTVYSLDAAALRQNIAQCQTYVGEDPFTPMPLARAPQFGNLVRLEGCEWLTPPQPGAPAQLLTFWTVLDTGPGSAVYGEPSLKLFVHLLDREQQVVGGADLLGAAPDTWRAGDTLVQLHSFGFPNQAGQYAVELGWYAPPQGPRLPVDNAGAPGQRILLEPIEVRQ
ncbi:MAG: glycosyltransferase family 39 protein [Anaerolineae bacterium]|nr:glycosyltransferase family 39 protein [Anaerolineae bacterium]